MIGAPLLRRQQEMKGFSAALLLVSSSLFFSSFLTSLALHQALDTAMHGARGPLIMQAARPEGTLCSLAPA